MPALPPDLYHEIVTLMAPLFEEEMERRSKLLPDLSQWEGFGDIIWTGSRNHFTRELVYQLPAAQLKTMLRAVLPGYEGEQQSEALCQRVDEALRIVGSHPTDPLSLWLKGLVARYSGPESAVDQRFVQLTLLVDQGEATPGVRFIRDSRRGRFSDLSTLLTEVDNRVLVLLGQPGSGKTTLLRRLLLEEAWREGTQASGRIPFFISLNFYQGNPPPDPVTWLSQKWQEQAPGLPPFEQCLVNGRILLLLDGLNEMPHSDRTDYRSRILRWRAFLQRVASYGNTILFSCRTLDYSAPLSSEDVPVPQIQIEPLPPGQIEAYLKLHLGDRAGAVWQALNQDSRQLALFATPFFLELLVEQVMSSGSAPTGRAALLTGFVRRALYREAVQRLEPLLQPGDLLTESDYEQVHWSDWQTAWELPTDGVLIPRLETLAHRMQDGQESSDGGQVRVRQEKAIELLGHSRASDIILAGIRLNVLDRERRTITYFHQLIQEYFAARVVAERREPERVAVAWRALDVQPALAGWLAAAEVSEPLPAAPTTGWEETMLLAAALTADQEQFVADLMAANLPLAARCAATPDVAVSPELVERLQTALLARIADPAADLRARIAAAEALGELGDPRFERRRGPYGDYLRPPTAHIPGRVYTIGDDDGEYDDEKPAHPVQIDAFEMGIFPVTNAEYRLFIEAGGYEDERWWETEAARAWLKGEASTEGSKSYYRNLVGQLQKMTDDAIQQLPNVTPDRVELLIWLKHAPSEQLEEQLEKWFPTGKVVTQPEFWDDSRFNHPAQPVVGVSWFEARAYCAWLSAQTGDDYCLPTEAEWEAAARGEAGRLYGYGNEYSAAHCNTFETHIRRTTPLGVFPAGQTLEGIADLSGNVWEWTTSQYRPYQYDAADGREDLDEAEPRRVLRGGSFDYNHDFARAAYRNYDSPGSRGGSVGGRLVVRRSPSRLDL